MVVCIECTLRHLQTVISSTTYSITTVLQQTYYYYYYIRLMAFFEHNLRKPAPER